jgi:hypothetical protein
MGPLLSSFVAAVQASLSVLLVISYGGIAARLGLLNSWQSYQQDMRQDVSSRPLACSNWIRTAPWIR